MNFTIDKDILLKTLENVIKAIDVNNIYVHLRNFYINVLDEMIIIKGSNGYFSIEDKIENGNIINIETIGSFLIPSSLFINIIKKCSGKIQIYSNNNVLYIMNENDKFEINLLQIDDYPNIDFSLYGTKIKVNANKLKKAIDNVIFATSQTNDEIILSGVNLKYEKGTLYISATDSFRLAREIIKINDDRDLSFDITVMNKNLKNFVPISVDSDVILYVNEHKINLIHNNTNYQSKIIEAPYKNIDQLFQTNFTKKLIIDKNVLNNAISKASIISSNDNSYNKIYISITSNEINLSTQAEEIGRTKVIIQSNDFEFEGEEISIVINFKFLKEAINVFNDKININLTKPNELILIDSEKSNNKQIISPMIS